MYLVYHRLGLCYYLKYSCLRGDTPLHRPSANCLSASIDVQSKNSILNALMESASTTGKAQQTSLQKKKKRSEKPFMESASDRQTIKTPQHIPPCSYPACCNEYSLPLSIPACITRCGGMRSLRHSQVRRVCVWNCCHVFHLACYTQTALWDPDGVPCQRLRGLNNFRSNIN